MPEGDTIHRTAQRLAPALVGQRLARFEAPRLVGDRPQLDDEILAVEAVGKHLLVRFPADLVLETHMRMTGSWHLFRPRQRWSHPAHLARVVIGVADWTAVCFAAPTVRTWYDRPGLSSPIERLGPDLCRDDPDFAAILHRINQLVEPGTSIAAALLDQRVACGIGNVFKSETLWACRVSPFDPIETVDGPRREHLWRTASRQLRRNLGSARRTTVPGGLAVYDRARLPCRRCDGPISAIDRGGDERLTYWCPNCQV